ADSPSPETIPRTR
nr:immunoglobulin heavy chain junction region [Homo sapiens]